MNSLTRLYLGFSWSVLFIIVYVVLLFVITRHAELRYKKHDDKKESIESRVFNKFYNILEETRAVLF